MPLQHSVFAPQIAPMSLQAYGCVLCRKIGLCFTNNSRHTGTRITCVGATEGVVLGCCVGARLGVCNEMLMCEQ